MSEWDQDTAIGSQDGDEEDKDKVQSLYAQMMALSDEDKSRMTQQFGGGSSDPATNFPSA